jgi:hypothetical protein
MHSLEAVPTVSETITRRTSKHPARLFLAPPAAALCYPFLLWLFHLSVTGRGFWSVTLSSLLLLMAIAVPMAGIYVYWRLGSEEIPSPIEVRAKLLALVSVGAPPLYTALGVLLTMARNQVPDLAVWVLLWAVLTAILLSERPRASPEVPLVKPPVLPRLRYAHGVSASAIVCIFLAMHLINHLAGLWSEGAHRLLMNAFRHVYRATLVEPLLVALILFQLASGPVLAWQYARRSVDFIRTLQIASGAYLFFFLLSHMNSVFIYARAFAKIPTDWDFATGAPTGLLRDAWNIRLLPHYLLGVFFVVTHLVLGARIVALAHNVSPRTANRLAYTGIAGTATLAVAIMLGMVGIHIGR